jgi:hypothetical protein
MNLIKEFLKAIGLIAVFTAGVMSALVILYGFVWAVFWILERTFG